MVTDFDKSFEIREFLWDLNLSCLQYPKQALKQDLNYKQLIGLIYDKKFKKKGLSTLDSFFREAIKQTIVTYCGLLKNEDQPSKHKKDDEIVKKIMRTNLEGVTIDQDALVLKEVEKHVSKYGAEKLAEKLGQTLGTKIYKQKSPKLIQQLINKEFPSHTSDFFNVKNFSNTLDRLYNYISKWMRNGKKEK
ncbi:MAG: hypothetical protein KKF52_00905 [Nanoarchaeota archaeon]|nr:hypothetical protein [Nanoarchaeota archaeon]MBU4241767.1 hypothetical protein [Nanoarchaeota archaeon]MBU4351746.1 hypothetical protein [Nanoarchaeota archaeon]